MKWRVAENEHNLANAPWRDAIGIEEVQSNEAVPALIAWLTRGEGQKETAELMVRLPDLLRENERLLEELNKCYEDFSDEAGAASSEKDRKYFESRMKEINFLLNPAKSSIDKDGA